MTTVTAIEVENLMAYRIRRGLKQIVSIMLNYVWCHYSVIP